MSDDFRRRVEALAREGSSTIFYNSGTERSVISLSNIFRKAKTDICIFAQSLCDLSNKNVGADYVNPATKSEYIEALEGFIESNSDTNLRIILQESIKGQAVRSEFLNTELAKMLDLQIGLGKNIEVRTTEAVEKIVLKSGDSEEVRTINFTLADSKMYRFEFDIEHRVAECCFNAKPEVIERLAKIFDQHWVNGTTILSEKQPLLISETDQ